MPGHCHDRRALLKGGTAVLFLSATGAARAAGWLAGTTGTARHADRPGSLAQAFADPPPDAGPGAYWYWLDGAVTREGISADLAAMQANGITLAILFSIGASPDPPLVQPPANALTGHWWSLVEHAVAEAERLGITLGLNACDGWATASGPWVEPQHSMQVLTWSEARAAGGVRPAALPVPAHERGWFRDVAVLAFPWRADLDASSLSPMPRVATTLPLAGTPLEALLDPANRADVFDTNEGGCIDFRFDAPFTLRSITIRTPSPWGYSPGVYRAANSLLVLAGDGDDDDWRPVGRLEYPRHGWQTGLNTLTHALPETRARRFRLQHVPEQAAPYREDYDFGQDVRLRLWSVVLSACPVIHHVEGKNASQWAISRRTTAADAPDAVCVDPASVLDLTGRLRADGTLDWTPPPGRWRILRIAATSNGRQNSAAGGAQGLEVDRFDAQAVRRQFERWFGAALAHVGERRAGRVLHYLHVDSWEASGQNWSAGFPAAFERLRGYGLRAWLPAMAGVPVASAARSEQVLHDVRRTVAELTQSEFFGTLERLAHGHGCAFSGEPASPTYVVDGLRWADATDMPMGEFWLRTPRNDKPTDVADAVSGGHVYGRRVIATESYTENEIRWDEHPGMLRPLGDRHYCRGVNRFLLHVYTAQPFLDRAPGMTLSGIGTPFGRTQTWWPQARGWFDYMRRCQAVLQSGRAVADAAVFIGEELPSRAWLPGLVDPPLPPGWRYDSIDREALLHRASVRSGRMELPGGSSYALLVIPGEQRYSAPLLLALARLVEDGLTVLAAPTNGPVGLDGDPRAYLALVRRLWGPSPAGAPTWPAAGERRIGLGRLAWGVPPATLLARLRSGPAFASPDEASLDWTHRAGPGWQAWFIVNTGGAALDARVSLRGRAGRLEAWDPLGGERLELHDWQVVDGRTSVPLALPGLGSRFVVAYEDGPGPRDAGPGIAPATDARDRLPDAVDLAGPWTLRFSGWRAPADELTLPRPVPWSTLDAHHLRHHSGTGRYATRAWIDPAIATTGLRAWLELGDVHDLAEVSVNGQRIACCWSAPFRADITAALRPGDNEVLIEVTNTWHNRLVGDASLPEDERITWVYPRKRGGREWLPAADAPLLAAGLAGPVRIEWQAAQPRVRAPGER